MKTLAFAAIFIAQAGITGAVFAQQQAQLVSVEKVKTEEVSPTVWLPGNVESRKNATLSAEQAGQLLWVVDVGSELSKGDVIAQIDDRHLKLQLAQQKAEIAQHKANVKYLQKQKKRLLMLKKENNASISELESTIRDLEVANSRVQALSLTAEQTQLSIEKTKIISPFSGHISERFVTEGELITRGRPIVRLIDTKHLDIQVAAPLHLAEFLNKGNKLLVKWQDSMVALPIRTWSHAGDRATRTFDLKLAADNVDVIAGSAVTVSLPKSTPTITTLVPRDAILIRENETFVMVLDEENKAKKVDVRLGQGVNEWIAVSGNIYEGEQVIIRGGERLQAGTLVRLDQATVVAKR